MVQKYGKEVDMRKINRSMEVVRGSIQRLERLQQKYFIQGMETEKCPACGCRQRKVFVIEYEKYKYYECEGCGMVYLANLPKTDEMYIGEETANGGAQEYEDQFAQRVDMLTKPKIEFILDTCRQNGISVDSWLDIGCGVGEILYYLDKNTEIASTGVETDPQRIAFIKEWGGNVIDRQLDADCQDKELMDMINTKDAVSMINVLEHIPEPKKMIDFLYRNMKEKSVLAIEVPRHPSAAAFANLMVPDQSYRHICAPVHLSIFSERSIGHLFEGKFRMIGKWGFGQGWTDIVNNAMVRSDIGNEQLYNQLLDCSNGIQKVLDEAGLSDSMIFVAVKI